MINFLRGKKAQQEALVGLPALLITVFVIAIFLGIAVTTVSQVHTTLVQAGETGTDTETMNFDTGSDTTTDNPYCTGLVSVRSSDE